MLCNTHPQIGAAFCFLCSWQLGRSLAGQFFWALLGSRPLVGNGTSSGSLFWRLAGSWLGCQGSWSLWSHHPSLPLFLGGSESQNNTREIPRAGALPASTGTIFVKVPLAKKKPKTNPGSRGGGIGSVSLEEEGDLRACFQVAHTIANDGRRILMGQTRGGQSVEACIRVALR